MSERRVSRRLNSTCPSVTNIFSVSYSSIDNRSKLPISILKVIETKKNISCSFINSLSPFEPKDDLSL